MKLWVRSKLTGGYIKSGHRYGSEWECVEATADQRSLLESVPIALEVTDSEPGAASKRAPAPPPRADDSEDTDPGLFSKLVGKGKAAPKKK